MPKMLVSRMDMRTDVRTVRWQRRQRINAPVDDVAIIGDVPPDKLRQSRRQTFASIAARLMNQYGATAVADAVGADRRTVLSWRRRRDNLRYDLFVQMLGGLETAFSPFLASQFLNQLTGLRFAAERAHAPQSIDTVLQWLLSPVAEGGGGLTTAELADSEYRSKKSVQSWVDGSRRPSMETICMIAERLNSRHPASKPGTALMEKATGYKLIDAAWVKQNISAN